MSGHTRSLARRLLAAMVLLSAAFGVRGQEVVIGQVAEFSGQAIAEENSEGARLWFEHVNATGRLGYRIVLKSYDDQRDARRTVELTRRLVDAGAIALFGYRSTPSLKAIVPSLAQWKIPLVAPFNGAQEIRSRSADWGFFLRATYREEAARLVRYLATVGIDRIAIVHQADAFGQEGLDAYRAALHEHGLAASGILSYDRKTLDVAPVSSRLVRDMPAAVLMACTPAACARIVKDVRSHDRQMLFLVMSNATTEDFIEAVAVAGRGVIMSQVMPYPFDATIPIVREFHRLKREKERAGQRVVLSYASLEGFASARLLTDALLRAGPRPTRERLASALRGMRDHDLGGIVFDAGARSRFVELTSVGQGGRIVR